MNIDTIAIFVNLSNYIFNRIVHGLVTRESTSDYTTMYKRETHDIEKLIHIYIYI